LVLLKLRRDRRPGREWTTAVITRRHPLTFLA
jgi:hypothetical protein